jgi:hypothetical protein
MPLDATARMQAASGTVDPAATSCTPALPNPTTDGSTLLLYIGMNASSLNYPSSADPPWYPDFMAAGERYVLRRPNQPGGETSWPMSSASAARWAWRAEEWASLSTIQPDASGSSNGTPGAQVYDLSVFSPVTTDIADYAALALFYGASGAGSGFPAGHSYATGYTELDYLTVGTGTTAGDFVMAVAETYPGVAETVPCTFTWDTTGGGSYAAMTVRGVLNCYQPSVPVFYGVLTA